MSTIHPFYYRQYNKNIRKMVHKLYRERSDKLMFTNEVSKPKVVTQTDGRRVQYTGP